MENTSPMQPNLGNNPQNSTKKSKVLSKKLFLYAGGIIVALLILTTVLFLIFRKKEPQVVIPQEVTINFWGISVEENVMQKLIDKFEKENPYIKVKYEHQTETDYKERALTRLKKQDPRVLPDIYEIEEAWLPQVASVVRPITFGQNLFASRVIKNNSISGIQYAYPYKFDSISLAYNTQELANIGFSEIDLNQLDWASLFNKTDALAKRETKQNDRNQEYTVVTYGGIAIGSSVSVTNSTNILKMFLLQNDAQIYDAKTKKYVMDNKFTETLEFFSKFVTNNIWSDNLGNDLEAFANGKVAMVLVRPQDIDTIRKLNPNLKFRTVLPAKIANLRNLSLSSSLVLPTTSPRSNESKKFLEFLSKAENLQLLFENKSNDKTFLGATEEFLNQLPKDSHFAVYSDITPNAERLDVPDIDAFSSILESNMFVSFNSYYQKLLSNYGNKSFDINTKKILDDLNATIKTTIAPTISK